MKRRTLSTLLALALCLGLAVPAFAAGAPDPFTVTAAGPDGEAPREAREFTLRDITVEDRGNPAKMVTMYAVFTPNEETEQAALEDVYILSPDDVVTLDGLRAGHGLSAEDEVALCAWSDPDGDGVYDRRLFNYTNYQDDITVVSLSKPGPFTYSWVLANRYSLEVYLLGPDALTTKGYSNQEHDLPSSATLSAAFLTRLFGPNTLVRLGVNSRDPNEAEDARFFYFYIPEGEVLPYFSDVPEWCADAVNWAAGEGVTTGATLTTFSPDEDCTQVQILTFLWRAAGKPEPTALPLPVEITEDLNYARYPLLWAAEKGLIDSTFDIYAKCTRATAASYIWQAFDKPEAGAGDFADVPAGADYAPAVAWAVENGITNGTDEEAGLFSPDDICTRGQIAALLHRAYVPEARLNAD